MTTPIVIETRRNGSRLSAATPSGQATSAAAPTGRAW